MTTGSTSHSHVAGMRQTYALWAGIYDFIYRHLFMRAQKRAAALAFEAGPHILEVGVGTGLTLSYFPKAAVITGIDISHDMLERAREKLGDPGLPQVKGLCVMDAAHLAFPDAAFDAVVFPFVIALVSDDVRALDEAARVLKPGGRIVIANRFGAERGVQAAIEKLLAPLAKAVGWSCDYKMSRVEHWARVKGDLTVAARHKAYFSVIALEKQAKA